jgi:hypothetical protein
MTALNIPTADDNSIKARATEIARLLDALRQDIAVQKNMDLGEQPLLSFYEAMGCCRQIGQGKFINDPDFKKRMHPRLGQCPRDTNGDGDCGRPLCPHCGEKSR